MGTDYNINYDDERFTEIEQQKEQALTEVEKTYGEMIDNSDSYYQEQINASKEWADKQTQLQQDNTDFAIEQIEQQKEQAKKDYLKEQSGAYADWKKQSSKYGANAEQMAASGLSDTGYSESSQVSMYNSYQNRVATARASVNQAILNYDNAIKEARLQNNSIMAEIAYKALQQELELSLQGFQYKNSLIENQLAQKQATEDRYYNRYQDVLAQMNQENALAEQIRQYNQDYELQINQLNENIRQFDAEMERLKAKDAAEYALEIEQLELQKQAAEQAKIKAEEEHKLEVQKLELQKQALATETTSTGTNVNLETSSSSEKASLKSLSSGLKYAVSSVPKNTSTGSGSYEVNTEYYQGALNSDAKEFGTFSNGYQPKGISGYGAVSKTGETIEVDTVTLSGEEKSKTQNVWKTPDGTLWYWEGRQNKYIKIQEKQTSFGGGGRSF